jgi:hypothetical protein
MFRGRLLSKMNQCDTSQPQCKVRSVISFPQKPRTRDLFEEDLHQGAMFVAQAKLHFCRARRNAPTTKNSRAVGLLIDGQQHTLESVQHLRNGRAL